ncbi:ATP-binding protein [Aeromonas veronii]
MALHTYSSSDTKFALPIPPDVNEPSLQPKVDWDIPNFIAGQQRPLIAAELLDYTFYRIHEISQENAVAYRLAMCNVLATLNGTQGMLVYLLSGHANGIDLYFGVATQAEKSFTAANQLSKAIEGNFAGVKLDAVPNKDPKLENLLARAEHQGCILGVPTLNEQNQDVDGDAQGIERLVNSLQGEEWQLTIVAQAADDHTLGKILDAIYNLSSELSIHTKYSYQQSEGSSTQKSTAAGVNEGSSDSWSKTTNSSDTEGSNTGWSKGSSKSTAKTNGSSSGSGGSSRNESIQTSDSSNDGSSGGTNISRTTGISESLNKGTTKGISKTETVGSGTNLGLALTRERINKAIEEKQKHLNETLIERFRLGRSKGMYRTAIYISARYKVVYDRLGQSVRSIFQGDIASATPLQIKSFDTPVKQLGELLQLRHFSSSKLQAYQHTLISHGIPFDVSEQTIDAATWLNTKELALLAGFPSSELPGLVLRKSVDFAVNVPAQQRENNSIALGAIIQHGRKLNNQVFLSKNDLSKHVFVTGVTGAGKTTTCMNLLLGAGLPFLVIEPAKTEYRALYAQGHHDVLYYQAGREDVTPFRLNPFELVTSQQNLAGHIAILTATLTSVYHMEAAMPQLVEEAIKLAYEGLGWNIHTGENLFSDDPWAAEECGRYWPIFSDMISKLDALIGSKGMGREFEEKYRGSLVARFTNLTDGVKGRMLNTRRSLDFDALLDKKVVIELEELKGEQDKALLMGLILGRLAESMKWRHSQDTQFQHLTLVEEAHRLLSRPEMGESDAKKLGVEMFANMLAEVRKYGEGLIIADQIPNKLIPDVIKNTHTKIVHRLFAADDRSSMGDAMSLSDEQKDFLPLLQTGETIVYCGGWHSSVRVQISQSTRTDGAPLADEQLLSNGRQQQWQQRHTLYPRLSRLLVDRSDMDATSFAFGVKRGIDTLNYLIGFCRADKADNLRLKNAITGRLQQSCGDLITAWGESVLCASSLHALLLDCVALDAELMDDWDGGNQQRCLRFLTMVLHKPDDIFAEHDFKTLLKSVSSLSDI